MAEMIGLSEDSLTRRKRLAEAMLQQGMDASPVQHWTQGASRLVNALSGRMMMSETEGTEAAQSNRLLSAMLGNSFGSGGSSGGGSYGDAIAGIESGGRYDALGPVTDKGDRAYGKYQVMGSNIEPWTEKYLGRRMSPQEFLQNPQAQDAVFNGQFGSYAQKYGPEGASRAWFAGEGGMNDMDRKDQLGTSVAEYSQKFQAGYGGQPQQAGMGGMPPQLAQQIGRLWQAGPQGQQMAMQLYAQYSKQNMDQKAEGAGVFGTPIYGTDPQTGETVLGVIGKDGSFQRLDTGGVQVTPGVSWQDFGTYRQPFSSKSGAPAGGPVQIDVAGEKAAEAEGKIQGESAANLENNLARADQAITTIDGLLQHPGLGVATGMSGQLDPRNYVAGTDATNFQIALKQAQGQVFLDAYERLKGGGVITEIEGQKAEQAIARLDRAQSDDEFRRGLMDLREVIVAGKERARLKAGAGAPPAGASGGWTEVAPGVRIREKQ